MWAISNLVDGREPSFRRIEEGWSLLSGEILVNEDPTDKVWDAANKRLRPKTTAELLAVAKRDKKAEGANRMHRENRALYPEVQEVEGAWVAEVVIDLVTEPRGQRIANIKTNKDRRVRFDAAVEAQTTVEAVRAVAWGAV